MKFSDFRTATRPPTRFEDDAAPVEIAGGLPAVVTAARAGIGLPSWIAARRSVVLDLLHRHAAVLLRGFEVDGAAGVDACIRAWAGEPMDYRENTSPRRVVFGRVRTSTEHPAEQNILLHNEHSYSQVFPLRLFLHCVTPATAGGETPLVDGRRLYERIPAEIRERFRRRGWLYQRHFVDGFGQSWQTVYQVADRPALDAYLRTAEIDWEWTPGGTLKTRVRRAAATRHPETGEPVWFNHILFWHRSSLDPALDTLLHRSYGDAELPHNTYFGDGEPIPTDVIDTLRAAYEAETRTFAWQRGDVLIVDNVLAAHGRAPFRGPREILFGMAEPCFRGSLRDEREEGA